MKNEVSNLVIDYLLNPDNKGKEIAFNKWLEEGDENRQLFLEMKQVWEATGKLPAAPFDPSAEWQALTGRINLRQHNVPRMRILPQRTGWWWAAAVIIPLLFVTGYWYLHSSGGNDWTSYTSKGRDIDSLRLPDGTGIFLKTGTTLAYRQNNTTREIKLIKGEAFFKVAKDEQRRFSIHIPAATITVLGTSFNVKIADTWSDVAVWDGKVNVKGTREQLPVTLTAGNLAVINTGGTVTKPAGNYAYRCGWSNHDLVFSDQEVATVIQTLASYYHVSLKMEDKHLLNNKITVRFNNVPLRETLLVLSEMLDLETQQVSDTAYVFKRR